VTEGKIEGREEVKEDLTSCWITVSKRGGTGILMRK